MFMTNPMSIEAFVKVCFFDTSVQGIVEHWRVEPDLLHRAVVNHFRDMGIFAVGPKNSQLILENTITYLKRSSAVKRMVRKAEEEEEARRTSRHAEGGV